MIPLIFEEMMDEVDELLIARVSSFKGCPEAEGKLIEWFAARGIDLTIMGWKEYSKLKELTGGRVQ